MRIAMPLFKSSSESLTDGNSIGDSFKSSFKPTLQTALKHGGKTLGKVIKKQDKPTSAPQLEPPPLNQDDRDAGTVTFLKSKTGARRYKASPNEKSETDFLKLKT